MNPCLEPMPPKYFASLAASYNFPLGVARADLFRSLIESEIADRRSRSGSAVRVLDVGCGEGLEGERRHVDALAALVDEFWGVEPDEGAAVPGDAFDRVVRATLEDADLPLEHFDIAYTYLVAEHVEHPERFLKTLRKCLRPGGVLLLLTPNERLFFGMASLCLRRLGLDERVLRAVRSTEELDSYHYPVQYRMNSHRALARLSAATGFSDVDIATVENPQDTAPYFPRGFRWIWRALTASRTVVRSRSRLLHLIARFER